MSYKYVVVWIVFLKDKKKLTYLVYPSIFVKMITDEKS